MEEFIRHIQVKHLSSHKTVYFLLILFFNLIAIFIYGFYRYIDIDLQLKSANSKITELNKKLEDLGGENLSIKENLETEQQKNVTFQEQINGLAGTIGNLDKLSKTDKELLQKYSKVYFLNEHYIPESLATITPNFVLEKDRAQKLHSRVMLFFERMMNEASSTGNPLLVVSSYRSFGEQWSLKNGYTVTYGSGANKFSADQGFSEHQLGTTVDLTTSSLGASFSSFEKTSGFKWLQENAYKYGFVLSYPKGNSYYTFEPWHWRFVGIKLATMLHNENKNFYDVDQRTIDNYLLTIFD